MQGSEPQHINQTHALVRQHYRCSARFNMCRVYVLYAEYAGLRANPLLSCR
jgi:hypothetical protein